MRQVFFLFMVSILSVHGIKAQCEEDCVWPGDLNANGIANNLDVLAIGFSIDETGPARDNPNNNWEGFLVDDWAGNLPELNKNFKHSDADGNGVVNSDDQFPISINYNLTNDSFAGLLGNNLIGNDLFLVPENLVASPASSFFVDIHLGTEENPINDIYGIGFQIDIDTSYVADVIFDFSDNWIGSGDEVLNYGKYSDEIEHIATTTTRLDGTTVSGFGKIARIEIVITDVVLGLIIDSTECLPFFMEFQNVLGINEFEEDLLIESRGDTLTLKDESQLTNNTSILNNQLYFKVFPNPAKEVLQIRSFETSITSFALTDLTGRRILEKHFTTNNQAPNQNTQIDIKNIPRGLYFLEIKGEQSTFIEKVFLE